MTKEVEVSAVVSLRVWIYPHLRRQDELMDWIKQHQRGLGR